MSEATLEQEQTEARESGLLHRTFTAEFQPGDGRTVDVRIVPFGVVERVSDGGPHYDEEWMAGSFDEQLVAGHRLKVLGNFEHQKGLPCAKAISLRSAPDALYGSFRMLNTQAGDTALELVNDGILDGVSLEAYPKKSVRTADGVVRRVKAHLDAIAFCRRPAYKDAAVLAVRQEVIVDETLLPLELDPELVERCRKAGIRLPARFELLERAFTEAAWDGSESRWPDAASYCAASLVDNNPAGKRKTKAQCHFPVREPGSGDINVNALRAVVGGRGAQASFPNAEKGRAEAQRLLAQYEKQQTNRQMPMMAEEAETDAADTPDSPAAARALSDALAACQRFMAAEQDTNDLAEMEQIMAALRDLAGGSSG